MKADTHPSSAWFWLLTSPACFEVSAVARQVAGDSPLSACLAFALVGGIVSRESEEPVLVDWFLIGKLTPRHVVIPESVASDYEDFSHHHKAHAREAGATRLRAASLSRG